MQTLTKAALLAAVAIPAAFSCPTSMLMDTASAVEVTAESTPPLPTPGSAPPVAAKSAPALPRPSQDCFILGSRAFSIPFTVETSGVQPVEVHLFVSRGGSSQWNLLERKRPDVPTKQFQFTAASDGEYWFATRTVDAGGRHHPAGKIEPQLKVYVDTTKPRVRMQVDADGSGRIHAQLAIEDATPLKNIQLRYATDNLQQWQTVDLGQLPADGKVQFEPADSWEQISVQFLAVDTPGNQSVVHQLLKRPRIAEAPEDRYATAPSPAPDSTLSPVEIGNTSVEIQPMPYRVPGIEKQQAQTVSNPVIQLDRQRPKPNPSLVTAHGYVVDDSYARRPNLQGFRGAGIPIAAAPDTAFQGQTFPNSGTAEANSSPSTMTLPPQFTQVPAPRPDTAINVPQINTMRPENTAPVNPAPFTGSPAHRSPAIQPGAPFENRFAKPQTAPVDPSSLPFAPPSVQGATSPPATTLTQQTLPPPATAEQISEGFDLNSPQQGQADEPKTRPRTAAEAMRPLSESSALPTSEPNETAPQENIPTAKPDSPSEQDRYQAKRSSPADAAREMAMGRAPVRFSDSLRFSLDYELEAVGNLGVEAIELYGSMDGGKSWQLWGRDPDRSSPFDIETKEEGVFGFRIVVVGQNGLASPRPLAGEESDIVVVVDTTAPKVRITGAQYGEGDRVGSLVIQYECEDDNLMQRPVALSFSDSPQGPWTTIAAGLRNDGDYVWPADPQLPRQLYLRIDVTDQSGNVGTYTLDEPIDAQGLAPRARIRGFQSLSGSATPPTDGQTARGPRATFK